MLTVHGLRLEQQVVEGLAEQGQHLSRSPVVTGNGSSHQFLS